MKKQILNDDIDACELIKETEEEIRRIRRQEHCRCTRGPSSDPYTSENQEERLLRERIEAAENIKNQVEAWMNTIPPRMQRIIWYSIFQKLSWNDVADRMGRNATPDSVRMELQRFIKIQ